MEEALPLKTQGIFAVFLGMLYKPGRTFEYLRDHAQKSWIFAAILALIFLLLPVVVSGPIASRQAQELFRTQIEERPEMFQNMTEEQQQVAINAAGNPLFFMVIPAAGVIFGLIISWLVWSGALHLVSTMSGGGNTFAQIWQMVVWSWLPFVVRGLMQTVYVLLTGKLITNAGLSGLVAGAQQSADVFAIPGIGQLVLQSFLSRIDLFLLWNLVLIFIGVAVMGRLSRRKAFLITLGVWAVFSLLSLIPAVISGVFTSTFSGM